MLQCGICQRPVPDGRDASVPLPSAHPGYPLAANLTVCLPCRDAYYARLDAGDKRQAAIDAVWEQETEKGGGS